MKRMWITGLAAVLVLALAGCGGQAPASSQAEGIQVVDYSTLASLTDYTGTTWDDGSLFAPLPKITAGTVEEYTLSEDGTRLDVRVTGISRQQALAYYDELAKCGALGGATGDESMTTYSGSLDIFVCTSLWAAAGSKQNSGTEDMMTFQCIANPD